MRRLADLFNMDDGLGPFVAGAAVVAASHYVATAAGGISPVSLAVRFVVALFGGAA